jgi:hypothetical protein
MGINLRLFNGILTASATTLPAAPVVGGTGATAGGYDTAGHRDAAIVTINALRSLLTELRTGVNVIAAELNRSGLNIRMYQGFCAASTVALPAVAAAGGTGADAGGWANSTDRDAAISTVTDLRTIASEVRTICNLFIADLNNSGYALRAMPTITVSATVMPAEAPAGGTGAAGGCYDTAVHRDAFIVTVNDLRTIVGEVKTAYDVLAAEINR